MDNQNQNQNKYDISKSNFFSNISDSNDKKDNQEIKNPNNININVPISNISSQNSSINNINTNINAVNQSNFFSTTEKCI